MSKSTWRERNPDKYRACQAATMRRRRAAAKQLKAGPSVAAVEQIAGTKALQECLDRDPAAVALEQHLDEQSGLTGALEVALEEPEPAAAPEPVAVPQASPESMTLHQWLAMTPDARRAWVQENRPGLEDDVAVQKWVTGLRP